MKKRSVIITATLLISSIGNYLVVISKNNIRAIEFLSIFAIGALSGVLLTQNFRLIKDKRKISS